MRSILLCKPGLLRCPFVLLSSVISHSQEADGTRIRRGEQRNKLSVQQTCMRSPAWSPWMQTGSRFMFQHSKQHPLYTCNKWKHDGWMNRRTAETVPVLINVPFNVTRIIIMVNIGCCCVLKCDPVAHICLEVLHNKPWDFFSACLSSEAVVVTTVKMWKNFPLMWRSNRQSSSSPWSERPKRATGSSAQVKKI